MQLHLLALYAASTFLIEPSIAAPNTPAPGSTVSYDDSFENLPSNGVNNALNLVDNKAGGALLYNAFAGTMPDPALLKVDNGKKSILSGLAQQSQEGQPAFYINSTVTSFDLTSIAYAITVAAQNGVVTKVQTGTIQLTGKKLDGSTVVQELVYNETLLTVAGTMAVAQLSTFTGLSRVDVELIQAQVSTSPALANFYFDSVKYKAKFASKN